MYAISEELLDWLPTLWQVGVEEAAETSLVRKGLLLCVEVVRKVENCGSPYALVPNFVPLMCSALTIGTFVDRSSPRQASSYALKMQLTMRYTKKIGTSCNLLRGYGRNC